MITIINGIIVFFLFRIVQIILYGYSNISMNTFPATTWSGVAYFILRFFKGHLTNIVSTKRDLDEMVSPNSTPFYVDFIKELKKELPHLSETIRWDMPRRECTYQIILDYAQSKLELYTNLNQSQNQYQTQIQQYAKIVSDAEVELQNLKTQREALPDGPETAQTGSQQAEGQAAPGSPSRPPLRARRTSAKHSPLL